MKKIKFLILLLGLASMVGLAQADTLTVTDEFSYGPIRPGINLYLDKQNPSASDQKHSGLNYVSYNNFTNNPNIPAESYGGCPDLCSGSTCTGPCPDGACPGGNCSSSSQKLTYGDERVFTVAKYCPNGICPTPSNQPDKNVYYNLVPHEPTTLKEGDVVRFEIYFHNNGQDPYKSPYLTTTTANNVKIGLDLNNIVDPSGLVQRPRGFIYAENNQYLNNGQALYFNGNNYPEIQRIQNYLENDSNTAINTATDDAILIMDNSRQYLEIDDSVLYLDMNDGNEGKIDGFIMDDNQIQFNTANNTTFTTNISKHYDTDKAWVHFSKLPGCFRYSGFMYFDVVVKETPPPPEEDEPVCTGMTLDTPPEIRDIDGEDTYRLLSHLTFAPNVLPEGTELLFESQDPNARFFRQTSGSLYGPLDYEEIQTTVANGKATFNLELSYLNNGIFYIGDSKVDITAVKADGSIWANICKVDWTPPPPTPDEPVCTGMTLDTPPEIRDIDGEDTYRLLSHLTFAPNVLPEGTELLFESQDPNARFFKQTSGSLVGPLDYEEIQTTVANGKATFNLELSYLNNGIFYIGESKVDITAVKADGSIWADICGVDWTPPPPTTPDDPICRDLRVNYNNPIEERTATRFESQAFNTESQKFDETITYSVDPGYGFFTTEKCDEMPDNPNDYEEEWIKIPNSAKSNPIFNPRLVQTNTLIALTDIQRQNLLEQRGIIESPLKNQMDALQSGTLKTRNEYIRGQLQETGTGVTRIPVQTILDACNGVTSITVNPGDTVYFYALKDSETPVVHLDTNNTEVNDCSRDFNIEAEPVIPDKPTCTDLTLIKSDYLIDGSQGFKLVPDHTFVPPFLRAEDGTLEDITTVWETSDTEGKFYTLSNGNFTEHSAPFTQTSQIVNSVNGQVYHFEDVYYTGADPILTTQNVSATTYDPQGNVYTPCIAGFPIEPPPVELVCEDIYVFEYEGSSDFPDELSSVEAGTSYLLSAKADYSDTVSNPKSVFTSNSGVFIPIVNPNNPTEPPSLILKHVLVETYQQIADDLLTSGFTQAAAANMNLSNTATIGDGDLVIFITYQDATDTSNALSVRAEDRDENECLKTFPLSSQLICVDLRVIDWGIPNLPDELSSLQANSIYELSSLVNYSKNIDDPMTTYSSDYGVFIAVPEGDSSSTVPTFLRDNILLGTYRQLAIDLQASGISSNNFAGLPKEVTVPDESTVFFVTFIDAPTSDTGLTVVAEGRTEADCSAVFPLTAIPEDEECVDLLITQPSGTWENNDLTDDEEQRFEIEVITSPESYKDQIKYRWDVNPSSAGAWRKGIYTDSSDANPFVNYLDNIDEKDEPIVSVAAIDIDTNQEIPQCRANKTYDFDEVPPEIEKFVYDIKKEEWRNTINIGGKATDDEGNWIDQWLDDDFQYVNYLIEFTPGSAISAEIWEEYINNGSIEGSLNGDLDYLELAIIVEPNDSSDPYVLFVSEDFEEDRYLNERIAEERIDDYDDFDEDIDDLEDKYQCENASNSVVCIANDYDDIEDTFRDGGKIRFGNLDEAERIYFVLQTENNTVITDDRCKELENTEGCGEIFDNTIHFDATRRPLDSDYELEDDEYDGDDSAKVIVICPYVIIRQGGDVFFRDILDVGVDIEYCSPVKTTEIIIREEPEDDQPTPKSGSGDEDDIVYQTPTHDVCKLSNTEESELEEFRNVLKNFSSSICEMSAEVSEIWVEDNINSSIRANIERIARYGRVTNKVTLGSSNELNSKGFTNLGSGVFVVENTDLIIGNGVTDYLIKNAGEIPAAQTYIVINGNIEINSNIKYDDSNVNPANPSSFPSASFIVIDGNININNSVSQIDGIMMAVDSDSSGQDGQIKSLDGSPTYDQMLLVNGSMIGDVYDIFFNRRAIGDPLRDEGSITVRYDERILLNTPPGLNELIDVAQLRSAGL